VVVVGEVHEVLTFALADLFDEILVARAIPVILPFSLDRLPSLDEAVTGGMLKEILVRKEWTECERLVKPCWAAAPG
jgi:hypothetical protein